jgi:hypothetical protein
MWLGAHALTGAVIAEAVSDEKWYYRYPVLAYSCFFFHLFLDSIPWVWEYHIIQQFPWYIEAPIYLWNFCLVLALFLFSWRRALEGLIFGWLAVDIERLWGGNTLHNTLACIAKLPYGGVFTELVFATALLAAALPARKRLLGRR